MKEVYDFLDSNNIKYKVVEHPEVFNTVLADKYVEGYEGVLTKSIFMSGKKKRRFYLFIMDDMRSLDIKKIEELVNDKLHFASVQTLYDKMGLMAGSVSLFGLLNNSDKDIEVFLDKNMINEELITFHPNINTETIFIKMDDMFKILDILNYNYNLF